MTLDTPSLQAPGTDSTTYRLSPCLDHRVRVTPRTEPAIQSARLLAVDIVITRPLNNNERVCLFVCLFVRVFVCPRSCLRHYTSDLH